MVRVFKRWLNHDVKYPPERLCTDKGTEFVSKTMDEKIYRPYRIIRYSTLSGLPKSAAMAERFIRTLRNILTQYFILHNTKRWVDILPSIAKRYNARPHSSTGVAPDSVTPETEHSVFEKLYVKKKEQLAQIKPRFRIGDTVRISHDLSVFQKRSHTTYTSELFIIDELHPTSPPTYSIRSKDGGDLIEGRFYNHELVKVEDDEPQQPQILQTRRRRRAGVFVLVQLPHHKRPIWMKKKTLDAYLAQQ